MSSAAVLKLDIVDAALWERLDAVSAERRASTAEAALRVGFAVLDAMALTVVPSAPGSALAATVDASVSGALAASLAPLSAQLAAVQTSLGAMLRAGDKSQQRGVLGEEAVLGALRAGFPLDAFALSATSAHAADIAGRVFVGPPEASAQLDVRVEVKNYASRAVPTAEVEKFRRDVRASGAPLGLFLSLASGIAGVRGRVAVERCDGATLVLVPDAGLDGAGAIWGMVALKAIAPHVGAGGAVAGTLDVDAALAAVIAAADELVALAREAAALEDALSGAARALDAGRAQALAMRRRALGAKIYLEAAARRAFSPAPAQAALPPTTLATAAETLARTNAYESARGDGDGDGDGDATATSVAVVSDALRPYAVELEEAARIAGCTTRRAGDETLVEHAGAVVARAGGKRNFSVAFDAAPGDASIEIGVEDVKGGKIVVNGNAPLARWKDAVKRRLCAITK